jgi:hypothetical protein
VFGKARVSPVLIHLAWLALGAALPDCMAAEQGKSRALPAPAGQAQSDQSPAKGSPWRAADNAAFRRLLALGRDIGRLVLIEARRNHPQAPVLAASPLDKRIQGYATSISKADKGYFFKGRYNRSRARLPENIDRWREHPDIANPGPDLANWPNSAFTLPQGRAYVEFEPFSYTAGFNDGAPQPAQYAMDFLLRYGLTDDIELRIFGNGPTRTLGANQAWNFSPLAFDTKVHIFNEHQNWFLPALGVEAYIQTQWLGNQTTNSGTQPSINFNFDQSLPWEVDFEYNLGAVRTQQSINGERTNVWDFSFQWSVQRDFFDSDVALFLHGYLNAPSLPRIPNSMSASALIATDTSNYEQNVVGGGFLWTVNSRLAMWGQTSFGTNRASPSLLSNIGLALAF